MSTEITSEFVWHSIPPRPRDSHKGSFGTVLAVAGSAYYRGAALLAAEGALRTGAGIVTLASVEPVLAAAVARLPECCLCPCVAGAEGGISPESIPQLQRQKATVLLLGPGLGGTAQSAARAAETRTLVQKLLPGFAGSAVLDADGLNAAAQLLAALEMHKLVDRWGLNGGTAPAPSENAAPLETVEPSPLPLLLEGRFYAARNADGDWYLVQGQDVYLPDTDRLAAILDSGAELWAFDAKPLYRLALEHGGIGSALRFDGKLAAYLLNPSASGYEVHSLAAEYGVHAAFACEAAPDAGVLAGLCDTLAAALDESGQRKLLDEMELPLARVLADMERIGFAVDADGIRAFGDSLRGELDGILHNIYTEVGYEFNVNSPKQLGEALFDKLGLPPRKKNARGYSTDAETLESLRPYSPVIDEILKYRTYAKLLSTYVDGLLNAEAADGRVHSTFIQTEARTGRISSTEPNLQNIPIRTELGSRLRGYFVAGAGETLVDADYSQIELRILAHITGDEHMQQAFLNGADIHRSTAAKIYHIPESEVTPQLRSASKAINFGIMYGKGAYSLSKDIGVSVKEADAFLKNYLATFPKVSGYMDKTISDARACGYVSTLFGRRRSLPELTSNNHNIRASGERMARNTPIQGTAADVIKLAMVRVWRRLRDEKMESRLILTVHDELIVEAPEAEAAKAASILQEEMEGCVNYAVPLSTEVHQGKNWLEAH